MTTVIESVIVRSPDPSSILCLKRASMALCSSPSSFRFQSFLRPSSPGLSAVSGAVAPAGLGHGLLLSGRRCFRKRSVFSFAASNDESKPSDVDDKSDPKVGGEESEEAWKQTLASFKEQAIKMQSISQEAYEVYSKRALVILKEVSDQFRVQAEKAREDLSVIAKELNEDGQVYISSAAENSPESLKEIVEVFASSPSDLNEISKVHDFYIGIPYGGLLCFGGFLSFMLTGSISAVRFGVILGGALLALSILSLKSWKRGDSSSLAAKGQAAIAAMLFLREMRLLFEKPNLTGYFALLVSGAAVAFYIYRLAFCIGQTKESNIEPGIEN